MLSLASLGSWHTVSVTRRRRNVTMVVDSQPPVFAHSGGRFQGLDLAGQLHLGGLASFEQLGASLGQTAGLRGCVARLLVGGGDMLGRALASVGVAECDPCTQHTCRPGHTCLAARTATGHTCACPPEQCGEDTACHAGSCGGHGVCEEAAAGATCRCDLGWAGAECQHGRNLSRLAFSGGSHVAYPGPRHVLRRLSVRLKFRAASVRDSLLMYAAQNKDGTGDFASLAIVDKHVEFR